MVRGAVWFSLLGPQSEAGRELGKWSDIIQSRPSQTHCYWAYYLASGRIAGDSGQTSYKSDRQVIDPLPGLAPAMTGQRSVCIEGLAIVCPSMQSLTNNL